MKGSVALVLVVAATVANVASAGHHHHNLHRARSAAYHKATVVKHIDEKSGVMIKHHHHHHRHNVHHAHSVSPRFVQVPQEALQERSELETALRVASREYHGAKPHEESGTALTAFPRLESFVEVGEDVDSDETPTKNQTNATNATVAPPPPKKVDPCPAEDDPKLCTAKRKVAMFKEVCDHATELLENATNTWDDSRQKILGKLKTAHIAITEAHGDQLNAAGDQVLGNLEQALDDTKDSLKLRPKVKALRKVKDSSIVSEVCLPEDERRHGRA